MRVPEEPVYIHLFRQNPVFTSLHLKSPVYVVPSLIFKFQWRQNGFYKFLYMTLKYSRFVLRSPCEVDPARSLFAESTTSEDLSNQGNHSKYKVYRLQELQSNKNNPNDTFHFHLCWSYSLLTYIIYKVTAYMWEWWPFHYPTRALDKKRHKKKTKGNIWCKHGCYSQVFILLPTTLGIPTQKSHSAPCSRTTLWRMQP